MKSDSSQVTGGLATRLNIVTVFACIFVEANASGLHSGLQAVVRIGGIIVALALFVAANRLRRAAALAGDPASRSARSSGFGREYWIVVAAEVVALVAGLVVINAVFGAHGLTAPWIAVVVGVHFFGLAPLWNAKAYYVVSGVALTLLGLAGFALYAAGASALTIRLVAGIGAGIYLYLTAAVSLGRGLTAAPAASPEQSQATAS